MPSLEIYKRLLSSQGKTNGQAKKYHSDIAMEATWDLDWVCGYFWWDWKAILPPIEKAKENRDFTVYGKLGEEVLKKWYTKD